MRLYKSDMVSTSLRKARVLLVDNHGLSHYTSYLAFGLSKYREIIFYGTSKEDFILTGASRSKAIEFHEFLTKETKIPKILRYLFQPLLHFLTIFMILAKEEYDIIHVQGHLLMFFLFIPPLKLKKKLYAGQYMMCASGLLEVVSWAN